MRLSRCEVRDHIKYRKNDRWRWYRIYRALQRLKSPMRYICEILGAHDFRVFQHNRRKAAVHTQTANRAAQRCKIWTLMRIKFLSRLTLRELKRVFGARVLATSRSKQSCPAQGLPALPPGRGASEACCGHDPQ